VTHRDDASAVAFITGHEDPAKDESALDWRAIAAFPGTLVLYMGVRRLGLIAERLVEAGRPPDEPVAAIGPGTAAELRGHGLNPDVLPERSVAEALVEALAAVDVNGRRVLIARAAEARDVLPQALT